MVAIVVMVLAVKVFLVLVVVVVMVVGVGFADDGNEMVVRLGVWETLMMSMLRGTTTLTLLYI